MKNYLILFSTLISFTSYGFSTNHLVRSPKALLMGDAFTAINDDSFTLFYNPASMARHKKKFTLYPIQGYMAGTNVLDDFDRFENIPDEPLEVADLLMNYPVHASLGTSPGFKIFNFGFNVIANESYDVLLRNRAHPMLDVDFKSDRGFIAGVGFPIGNHRIKENSGMQTSIGVSAKYITRQGMRDTFSLMGPTVIDSLGKDDLQDILKSLGSTRAKSWGYDLGLEHIHRSRNSQLVVGLSYLDIGNTEFKSEDSGTNLSSIGEQLNLGLAFGQKFGPFSYKISADIKHLNEDYDFNRKFKTGAEISFSGLSLLAGINGGYYSYGAKLDFGLGSLMAGFYDEEIGHSYKQTKSRRMIIYLSLFDFSFNV